MSNVHHYKWINAQDGLHLIYDLVTSGGEAAHFRLAPLVRQGSRHAVLYLPHLPLHTSMHAYVDIGLYGLSQTCCCFDLRL